MARKTCWETWPSQGRNNMEIIEEEEEEEEEEGEKNEVRRQIRK
jgi:hypothetical protein